MNDLGQSAIYEVCERTGIDVADSKLGVGRELSYRRSPARTIVVHFVEVDFPNQVRRLLAAILDLEARWLLFNRHGNLREKEFGKNEITSIVEFLIQSFPAVDRGRR
ncbi:MAG: hypothetical protein MZU95_10510 [Desulfomicrobium escambiense]|nr:hypothetical protein [Desulfomicrobium escambiense]